MKKIYISLSIFTLASIVGIITYAKQHGIDVLEPQGLISSHQRDMFWLAVALGLAALIPVFILTAAIVYRYKSRTEATSTHNRKWEVKPLASWMWAAYVVFIITILAVFMYKSTFMIDPYKPLAAAEDTQTIQVVALPWKWLFIYPEENIAAVNELVIPVNIPIAFELTADAPMSSFWIPKLGGMIYAMEGMVTKHNLIATSTGEFEGINTEINGAGYSGMKFKLRAVSESEYQAWVVERKEGAQVLDDPIYAELAKPSVNDSVQYYAGVDQQLFGKILAKFMSSGHVNTTHDEASPASH